MEYPGVRFLSDPWYVIYCKSGKEFFTANILHNHLGLTVYLPEIEQKQPRQRQGIPFFSGYFFLQANLHEISVSRINTSPGVLKLLDFGSGPLSVPQPIIEILREELSQPGASSRKLAHQQLLPGDAVRITGGPLEGLKAVFIESLTSGERARVLLHFLGHLNRAQVERNALEKVSTGSEKRERQTRGKRRSIHKTQASDAPRPAF